jgi:putative adhesin
MPTTLTTRRTLPDLSGCSVRFRSCLLSIVVAAITSLAFVPPSFAQLTSEFHRTLTVGSAEPVTLDVEITRGDLQIVYGRDGQITISGVAKTSADVRLDDNFFSSVLAIDQEGNHLHIRHLPNGAFPETGISVRYRIDVPYRTEVTSSLGRGKQNISGVLGPVAAVTDKGDVTAAYISRGVKAQVGSGTLDLQVIGEHVEAKADSGNISCTRLPQGVRAETGDGDISLMVVGPSTAIVKKGNGRIDVGGARSSFAGSTDAGDLHVKAIPHDDWQLTSTTGSVRLELPSALRFELDASTETGKFQIDLDGIAVPDSGVRQFRQDVNGGGKRIQVHTNSGTIMIR